MSFLLHPPIRSGWTATTGEELIIVTVHSLVDANTRRSIWDLFRSQTPFLTVIDTPTVVDMVKGLLTIYEYQGWLPDCHMSLNKGFTQGGSNADNVMADAYAKLPAGTGIDWDEVYEAVVKDAEEEPYGMLWKP